MRLSHALKQLGTLALAWSLLISPVAPARAGLLTTGQAIAAEQGRVDRQGLLSALEREDLRRQLAALGVDVASARERVAALTDSEVARLNQRLAELPAGGDVLGVILLLFIVFIVTDALGATDIFPFVHPVK
jgi:uncharacterized membrane protein YgcG